VAAAEIPTLPLGPEALSRGRALHVSVNLPRLGGVHDTQHSPHAVADLTEVVRCYGIRHWVEQGYKQVKTELGWADFQVRSYTAIRRHQALVHCAFSFCWNTFFDEATTCDRAEPAPADPAERGPTPPPHAAGFPCWPKALRQVRSWLTPWMVLRRLWAAWSDKPPPVELQQLLDAVTYGRPLNLYISP